MSAKTSTPGEPRDWPQCPEGKGACQCVDCAIENPCVDDPCLMVCDGPVDGCEPPEDGENEPV